MAKEASSVTPLQCFSLSVTVWDNHFSPQEYMEKLHCACGGMLVCFRTHKIAMTVQYSLALASLFSRF
jgi:hypothetical protein